MDVKKIRYWVVFLIILIINLILAKSAYQGLYSFENENDNSCDQYPFEYSFISNESGGGIFLGKGINNESFFLIVNKSVMLALQEE